MPKKAPSTVGSRIRSAIDKSGLTRREVAEKAGVSLDTLYKLMAGEREPLAETVVSLCRALGVEYEMILGPRG